MKPYFPRPLRLALLALALLLAGTPAHAQSDPRDKIKIGYLTTLSGPAGIIGEQMQNAVRLALDHKNHRLGGIPAEVIFADDQFKPDVARQAVTRLLKRDRVDIMAGIIWSNVLLAVEKQITGSGRLLIGSNAGPSQLAGAGCNQNFFSLSWQNDQNAEAMGAYMESIGIDGVYLMAPNYQAGKDMLAGFKRHFTGEIIAEVYTQLGQNDFQAEFSALRAKAPEAVFIFQPGGMGINFVKQWHQGGMDQVSTLYSVFTVDAISLPALRDSALGTRATLTWSPDLDNAINKKFVADYKARHGGYPSFYAAQAYDTMLALDYAIKGAIGEAGGVATADLRAVLARGNIPTTRGVLAMNSNHFPIQNIYLREAVLDDDGVATTKIIDTVFADHADHYVGGCILP